jgi:hypothetical protein
MRFVTIIGARPHFTNAAPLIVEQRKQYQEFLVRTGQHYDDNMSDVFFRDLNIPPPDCYFGVNSDSSFYAGSTIGNGPGMMAEPIPSHGRPASIRLNFPPLGVCVFKPCR